MNNMLLRRASMHDRNELSQLMEEAICELQKSYLTPHQISQCREIMGLHSQLIKDQTYFVIEKASRIVACGGWSFRATQYGGDNTGSSDAGLLDSRFEAAKMRAFYTHPEHTRMGLGKSLLEVSESDAYEAGFRKAELVATLAGEPLYKSQGYVSKKAFFVATSDGTKIPVKLMTKQLSANHQTIQSDRGINGLPEISFVA